METLRKTIPVKKHGRKLQSYFRYGLDYVRDILLNEMHQTKVKLSKLLSLLAVNGNLLNKVSLPRNSKVVIPKKVAIQYQLLWMPAFTSMRGGFVNLLTSSTIM